MREAFAILILLGIAGTALAVAPSADAVGNEMISYTYDAAGRLTNVTHTGSVNNNVQSNYTYDKADNRLTYNVTGAP